MQRHAGKQPMRPHAGVKFSAPRANMGIKTTSTPSSSYQDSGAEESGQSDAEMGGTVVNTPKRPMTGGKFVPGYTPSKGFSTMRLDDEADESDEERSQTAGRGGNDDEWAEEPAIKDYDDDDDDFKPDFDDDDEEADGTYGAKVNTPRTPIAVGNAAPKSGGKGRAVNNVTKGKMVEKTTYKKKPRKDACRFTTTQAMIDAEEEMHPKVAALVGKKIIGEGNGRKGGRKLIRWNTATDQLLLLCLHHELAMIRDDLPYEQIAARMFPEKCATGGAIKERFAKLRIECLNRGSWVPPIIGKTPQGTRPNVRGVVRLAPGMDRGRFILWKEDASRLIDPKDIMKGYNDAQAQGLEFPQRRWIAESSKEEFYRLKKEMEARGLMPEGAIPVDDAEEEEEGDTLMDDADEDDEDDDENAVLDDVVFTTPANRKGKGRAIGTPASRKRQGTTPHPTSTPAKRQSTGRTTRTMTPAIKQEFMGTPTPGPVVTPKTARGRGRPPKNKVAVAAPVGPPKRLVLIMRGVAPAFLYRFPNGVSGVGATEYYEDEVKLMMLKNAKVEVTQVADHSALEVAPGLNSSQLNAGGAAPVANPNAFGGGNVLVGMQDGGFGPDDDDASVPVVLPGNLPAIHPSLFMRFPENIQNALLNNTVSDLIWEEGSNEFWRHDVLIQHAIANFDEVTGVIRDQNMFAHQMKILQQGFEQYNIPLGNGLAEGGGQFDDNFTLGSPNQAYRAAGGGRAMDDGDISPRNTYGGQSFDMNDYIQDGGSQASGSGRN